MLSIIDKATLNGSLLKILNEIESFFKRNTRYATKIIGFEGMIYRNIHTML